MRWVQEVNKELGEERGGKAARRNPIKEEGECPGPGYILYIGERKRWREGRKR